MQKSVSKIEPGASGFKGVPGYLLPKGLSVIMTHLRDRCRMRGSGSVFCDVGCGEARPLMAALEASPRIRGAVGIEIDETTLLVAESNLDRFSRLRWDGDRYVWTEQQTVPACLVNGDMKHVRDLGCVTHAYCFCFGMPPDVLLHLFRLVARTDSLRYVVLVYKNEAGDLARELLSLIRRWVPAAVHDFVSDGRSQLAMPGQVVHGSVVRLSDAARHYFRLNSHSAARPPITTIDQCLS